MIRSTQPDPWEIRYQLAKAYYEENGNLKIPLKYRADGVWLAKWVNEQKHIYAGNRGKKTLREDQVRRLEMIGMEWGVQKVDDRNRENWNQDGVVKVKSQKNPDKKETRKSIA